MNRERWVTVVIAILLISMLSVTFNIRSVKAIETITIKADGSIDPPTAPVSTVDNVTYTLTSNITYPTYDGIVVERSNIVIEGASYTLQGKGVEYSIGILLSGISNVTIKNMGIKAFYWGIYLKQSSYNSISGNTLRQNEFAISVLHYSAYNTISENSVTESLVGIMLYNHSDYNQISENNMINTVMSGTWGAYISGSSDNNIVIANNVTRNFYRGIFLRNSTNNTLIANNITGSLAGIDFWMSSGNTIYHNNFIDNEKQVHDKSWDNSTYSPSKNTWDYGYPAGGNYWSDCELFDNFTGPNQDQSGSDNIVDVPYIIDTNNKDRYPLINPYHCSSSEFTSDIAVTNGTISKTIVGEGFTLCINASVTNQGQVNTECNITFYANATVLQTQNFTLQSGDYLICTCVWNTSGFARGNYTLWVYAWSSFGELDTADNTLICGIVTVSIQGDINADGTVDILDIFAVARAFGSKIGDQNWDPKADLNNDNRVDILDIFAVAKEFGRTI